MKPNHHTPSSDPHPITPGLANRPGPFPFLTMSANAGICHTVSAARAALRAIPLLTAVVFLLTGSAFAEDLPSFIQVNKKYTFSVAVDPKTSTWTNINGTVTELDTAGWLTIREDRSQRLLHLNMKQVFYATETP